MPSNRNETIILACKIKFQGVILRRVWCWKVNSFSAWRIMMNIFNNNQNYTLNQQNGTLNVLGNNNTIRITRSQLTVSVNGNHNNFIIHAAQATFNFNGNHNTLTATQTPLSCGFNGNHNHVQTDTPTHYRLLYCNGLGNQSPNPNPRHQNQNRNQQPQPRNNNANRRRDSQQPNRQNNNPQFTYSHNQPSMGFRQRHNYNYNPQQPMGFNPFNMGGMGFGGLMGGQNFMAGFTQAMNQMFAPMDRRNRQFYFNNQQRNYDFQGFEPEEVQIIQYEEQEEKGLNAQELEVLPHSRHEGRDGKCTICLCEITTGEEETFLMCFHPFHSECIEDWLKKTAKCPICQFDVKRHLRGEQ